jgi:hypothetical protein
MKTAQYPRRVKTSFILRQKPETTQRAHIGKRGSVTTVPRPEVLKVVIMKFQVFWYVTLCILMVTDVSLFLHYLRMEMEALKSIRTSLHI